MNIQPCPYCNEPSDYRSRTIPSVTHPHAVVYGNLLMVECQDCGACGRYAETENGAISAWNAVYNAVMSDRLNQTELEAYRALSDGKTAIEYAEWIGSQRRLSPEDVVNALLRIDAVNTGAKSNYAATHDALVSEVMRLGIYGLFSQ